MVISSADASICKNLRVSMTDFVRSYAVVIFRSDKQLLGDVGVRCHAVHLAPVLPHIFCIARPTGLPNQLIDAPRLCLAPQGKAVEHNDLGTDAAGGVSLVGANEMPSSVIRLKDAPLQQRDLWFVIYRGDFPDRHDYLLFIDELSAGGRGSRASSSSIELDTWYSDLRRVKVKK
jgi:hypothetical protein